MNEVKMRIIWEDKSGKRHATDWMPDNYDQEIKWRNQITRMRGTVISVQCTEEAS